jgi:hypothetical protein
MPITDFSTLEWLQKINRKHRHNEAPVAPADAYNHRFDREAARNGVWPPYSAFLVPLARERLARLYARDIEAYGGATATHKQRATLALVGDAHLDSRS